MNSAESIIARLSAVVHQRQRERPAGSYTTALFEAGHPTMAAKIIEEAYELIAAAGEAAEPHAAEVVHEAADLVYHLLVFLAACDCRWSDVERELERRFGVSGFSEKMQRNKEPS
uniref:Phosphoribosyl-ATP pyrophosphatase n=1 Tax=Schlesneria paludicola TaxID=360056 RepID=A0A7C4LKN5_9PLAN